MSAMEKLKSGEVVDFAAHRERRMKNLAAKAPTVEALSSFFQPVVVQYMWFGCWMWPVAVMSPPNART